MTGPEMIADLRARAREWHGAEITALTHDDVWLARQYARIAGVLEQAANDYERQLKIVQSVKVRFA